MVAETGLDRRLGRSLLLQAIYISLAVLVGVFVSARLVENVLIEQALIGESDYYWTAEASNPQHPLPDTKNMTSYRSGFGAGVPEFILNLSLVFTTSTSRASCWSRLRSATANDCTWSSKSNR